MGERTGPGRPFEFDLAWLRQSSMDRRKSPAKGLGDLFGDLRGAWKSAWSEAVEDAVWETHQQYGTRPTAEAETQSSSEPEDEYGTQEDGSPESGDRGSCSPPPPPSFDGDASQDPDVRSPMGFLASMVKNLLMSLVNTILGTLFRGLYLTIQKRLWPTPSPT